MASFEPPTVRKFVARQMELMQTQGLSRKAAFRVVAKEMVEIGCAHVGGRGEKERERRGGGERGLRGPTGVGCRLG